MTIVQDTEQRIIEFLKNYPKSKLRVVVGFASIWGLAWLNHHTDGRQVDLLIGNTDAEYFEPGTSEEREGALDFLEREDVTVAGWNKMISDRTRTITIAWHVVDSEPHLLAGSAHLSQNGLQLNEELMAEIARDEIDAAVKKIDNLFDEASDCRQLLKSYIDVNLPA